MVLLWVIRWQTLDPICDWRRRRGVLRRRRCCWVWCWSRGRSDAECRRMSAGVRPGGLYTYAVPVLIGTCVYLIMEWADILILGRFVAADQVGVYRACTQICVIFDMIILATNLAAAHIFPVLDHEKRSQERNETYRHVTLLVALALGAAVLSAGLHAGEILALLGPELRGRVARAVILAGGRLIRNGLGSSAFLLVLSGRQSVEMKNAATGGIANIVLNLALIPALGVSARRWERRWRRSRSTSCASGRIRRLMDVACSVAAPRPDHRRRRRSWRRRWVSSTPLFGIDPTHVRRRLLAIRRRGRRHLRSSRCGFSPSSIETGHFV